MLRIYRSGLSRVVQKPKYMLLWAGATLVFFMAYIALPAVLIPGNSLAFQIATTPPQSYALFALFAVFSGLLVTVQVYAWRHKSAKMGHAVASGSSSALAIFGAVVKVPVCASCIAPILAFFGVGFSGVLFTLEHQNEIALAALTLVLVSLHFSLRSVSKSRHCPDCEVTENAHEH